MTDIELTRGEDGRYHGTYKGHELQVWREPKEWQGSTIGTLIRDTTRKDVVQRLLRHIDASLVSIPELDQLLARWTAEVKAIILSLNRSDVGTVFELQSLQHSLQWLETDVRHQAVEFERNLARLKSHVTKEDEPALLKAAAMRRTKL
jgi:hypothetical protein